MSEREKAGEQGGRITAGMSGREQVGKTADRLRDELLLTLEELERRRERTLNPRYHVNRLLSRNRELFLRVGFSALVLVGVGVGVSRLRARRREAWLWKARWLALQRAWAHPERVASTGEERPFGVELGRRLILIFATSLAGALARRSSQGLVPASSEPHAAAGSVASA